MSTDNAIALRLPSTHQPPDSPTYKDFTGPPGTWLAGTWHVAYSSLPLWKDKRNVNVTYVNLPGNKVQDTTAYTADSSSKVKSMSGVNTPSPSVPAAYDWRGSGWLTVATTHWEILGWGNVNTADNDIEEGPAGAATRADSWLVEYFTKTLFTPAAVSVYSRNKKGLPEDLVAELKEKLALLEDPELKGLIEDLFEVKQEVA